MTARHPFRWLAETKQPRAFAVLVPFTLALAAIMLFLDRPLRTPIASQGIVSYELAGTLPRAREILTSWGERGRLYAGVGLGLDYLYLLTYSGTLALGCWLVVRRRAEQSRLRRLGILLAWAMFAAAACDAIENFGLIRTLLGSANALWPALARVCALVKFALVGVGLGFVLVGGLANWLTRRSARSGTR